MKIFCRSLNPFSCCSFEAENPCIGSSRVAKIETNQAANFAFTSTSVVTPGASDHPDSGRVVDVVLAITPADDAQANTTSAAWALLCERTLELEGNLCPYHPDQDRYCDVKIVEQGRLPGLNANVVEIEHVPKMILAQYPKPDQLDSWLKVLVENKCDELFVLVSTVELGQDNSLKPYFLPNSWTCLSDTRVESVPESQERRPDATSGPAAEVATTDSILVHAGDGKKLVNVTRMDIHDRSAPSPEQLEYLVKRAINSGCIAIHCRAGAGRTGVVAAAIVLESRLKASVEGANPDKLAQCNVVSTVLDLRQKRSRLAVQRPEQLVALGKFAERRKIPLMPPLTDPQILPSSNSLDQESLKQVIHEA